jgi:hypothetical protein
MAITVLQDRDGGLISFSASYVINNCWPQLFRRNVNIRKIIYEWVISRLLLSLQKHHDIDLQILYKYSVPPECLTILHVYTTCDVYYQMSKIVFKPRLVSWSNLEDVPDISKGGQAKNHIGPNLVCEVSWICTKFQVNNPNPNPNPSSYKTCSANGLTNIDLCDLEK